MKPRRSDNADDHDRSSKHAFPGNEKKGATMGKRPPVSKFPQAMQLSVTQYGGGFKNVQRLVAVNQSALLGTPAKKQRKLQLPDIHRQKRRGPKGRRKIQQFEDVEVELANGQRLSTAQSEDYMLQTSGEVPRRQKSCGVRAAVRTFSNTNPDSGPKAGGSTAGAGPWVSPLSVIVEKRRVQAGRPGKSLRRGVADSRQTKAQQSSAVETSAPLEESVEQPPPLKENVPEPTPATNCTKTDHIPAGSANATAQVIIGEVATITTSVPAQVPQPELLEDELQKIKDADGLRHFMWPITPLNLVEEEETFFRSGCRVNPQFEYKSSKMARRMIRCFKPPAGNLLPLATKIIEAFMKYYGSESQYLEKDGGDVLTLSETKVLFQKYIDDLALTELVTLDYSYNAVSPTTISHDMKTGKSVITLGLPIEYRRNRIVGVLNHEIGTHFLRNYNDMSQPWFCARKKNHLKNYLNTEEGLASLNQLCHVALSDAAPPFLFQCALYYYTCNSAINKSFVELFDDLAKYIDNPRRRYLCFSLNPVGSRSVSGQSGASPTVRSTEDFTRTRCIWRAR